MNIFTVFCCLFFVVVFFFPEPHSSHKVFFPALTERDVLRVCCLVLIFPVSSTRILDNVTLWWGPGIQPRAILTWALQWELVMICLILSPLHWLLCHWKVSNPNTLLWESHNWGIAPCTVVFFLFWQAHFPVQCCCLQLSVFLWHCSLLSLLHALILGTGWSFLVCFPCFQVFQRVSVLIKRWVNYFWCLRL